MSHCCLTSVAVRQHTLDKTTTAQNTGNFSFSFAAVYAYVQNPHIIINGV